MSTIGGSSSGADKLLLRATGSIRLCGPVRPLSRWLASVLQPDSDRIINGSVRTATPLFTEAGTGPHRAQSRRPQALSQGNDGAFTRPFFWLFCTFESFQKKFLKKRVFKFVEMYSTTWGDDFIGKTSFIIFKEKAPSPQRLRLPRHWGECRRTTEGKLPFLANWKVLSHEAPSNTDA